MDNNLPPLVCQICKKECKTFLSLHGHLRAHKILTEEYYPKFFPRFDKYDGSSIVFENVEQYFKSEFNSNINLSRWMQTAPKEEAIDCIKRFLLNRKHEKNLIYAPTQIELRSLRVPGKKFLGELTGDYDKFCRSLGFMPRYPKTAFEKPIQNISKFRIIVDTREQKPLSFNLPVVVGKLDFGDYRLSNDKFSDKCYIERKSICDFCGTMGKGFDRFQRELERAHNAGAYVIIIVEDVLGEVFKFTSSSFLNKPVSDTERRKDSPTAPESILHFMRELIKQFPNIQFLFVDGRAEASRVIEKIFACDGEYKSVDLQFLYDCKIL